MMSAVVNEAKGRPGWPLRAVAQVLLEQCDDDQAFASAPSEASATATESGVRLELEATKWQRATFRDAPSAPLAMVWPTVRSRKVSLQPYTVTDANALSENERSLCTLDLSIATGHSIQLYT